MEGFIHSDLGGIPTIAQGGIGWICQPADRQAPDQLRELFIGTRKAKDYEVTNLSLKTDPFLDTTYKRDIMTPKSHFGPGSEELISTGGFWKRRLLEL